jgi:hypothetical protein
MNCPRKFSYSHTGNTARFDEAMRFVEQRLSKLVEQGISNSAFSGYRAICYALLGDIDAAFDQLRSAVDGGWVVVGDLVEVAPAVEPLENDPRLTEIEATMLARVNEFRGVLDLAPFDENYQVLQQPVL